MKYVIYIISIIVITMLMVFIGHFKDKSLPIELTNKLYKKCRKKVIEYLEKNQKATMSDIKKTIKDMTASVFWSRKKVKLDNPGKFADSLMNNLVENGIVVLNDSSGKKYYELVKSE